MTLFDITLGLLSETLVLDEQNVLKFYQIKLYISSSINCIMLFGKTIKNIENKNKILVNLKSFENTR